MTCGCDHTFYAPTSKLYPRLNPYHYDKAALKPYDGLDGLLVRTALIRSDAYPEARRKAGKLRTPSDVYRVVRHLGSSDREIAAVIALDRQSRPMAIYEVALGDADGVKTYKNQQVKVPLLVGAQRVYLVHNHPSGSRKPSKKDQHAYQAARKRFALLGIKLEDSLVVTRDGWTSVATGRQGT